MGHVIKPSITGNLKLIFFSHSKRVSTCGVYYIFTRIASLGLGASSCGPREELLVSDQAIHRKN